MSLPPARSTADHRLRSEVSLATSACVERRVDADVKESIQCGAYLAPIERDSCCCRNSDLTCTWQTLVRDPGSEDINSFRALTR